MPDDTKDLFADALALRDDERAAFLEQVLATDAARGDRLRRLLVANDAAGRFLHDETRAPADDSPREPVAGEWVGPYELLELLGRGGFGSVWRAMQRWPLEREVAVKVGRSRSPDAERGESSELERHALARLQHPGVARVYDAGTTYDGRPWIAMELVHGVPITSYCRDRALSLPRRLSLFVEVCAAVQYVHTRGIVHLDLKPANVLICDRDGRARPVIIDFGIARDRADEGEDDTLPVVGTPEYMSPEQLAGEHWRIDARADVYALGVLLYELACGRRPFESDGGAFASLRLVDGIRHAEAAPPSAHAATRLPPELDWITKQALEKEPAERYATALALAEDVGRSLRSEPVLAGPAGSLYRLRCFVRRRRFAVAGAVALSLSLLGGAVAAGIGWHATQRALDAAREQQGFAEAASHRAERALELLENLWGIGEPNRLGREGYTVRELLADCARELPQRAGAEPLVAMRVHRMFARLQIAVGDMASALAHAEQAVLLARHVGDAGLLSQCLLERAEIHHSLGDPGAGYRDATEVVAMLADDAPGARAVRADAEQVMASCAIYEGDFDAADEHARRALGLREQLGDAESVARSLCQIAAMRMQVGRIDDAKQLLERAQDVVAPLGSGHAAMQAIREHRALLERFAGRPEATDESLRRGVELRRAVYGPEHGMTAWAEVELGWCLAGQGRLEEAEPLLVHGHAALQGSFTREHVFAAEATQRLGDLRRRQGRIEQAVQLLGDAAEQFRGLRARRPDALANCLGSLAVARWEAGEHAEALALLTEALRMADAELPPDSGITASLRTNLATLHARSGDFETAVVLLRDAMQSSVRAGRRQEAALQRERLQRALRELGREAEAAAVEAIDR